MCSESQKKAADSFYQRICNWVTSFCKKEACPIIEETCSDTIQTEISRAEIDLSSGKSVLETATDVITHLPEDFIIASSKAVKRQHEECQKE